MSEANIRLECLRPANDGWEQPTGEEVREALKAAGFTGGFGHPLCRMGLAVRLRQFGPNLEKGLASRFSG